MTTTAADQPLKIAIIGASASGSWARESHVPAIQALEGYELAAVATRSQESADAAELFADDAIDVVTVGVRVPAHRELVLAAVAVGKHVVTEWPLGRDLREARELRDAAAAAGVHAVVGLQARMSPAVRRARELIEEGALGRILSVRLYDSTIAFGPATTQSDVYLEDAANGATHISIHGGHSLDLAARLTGGLIPASVLTSTQHPRVSVEGAEELRRTIPDHLLVLARTRQGAPVSVEVAGGRPADATPFRLDVVGTEHHVALVGGAIRGFQSGRLTLLVDGEPQDIEDFPGLSNEAANVAGLYQALRDDIADGTTTTPGFDDAVELTQTIADAKRPPSVTGH